MYVVKGLGYASPPLSVMSSAAKPTMTVSSMMLPKLQAVPTVSVTSSGSITGLLSNIGSGIGSLVGSGMQPGGAPVPTAGTQTTAAPPAAKPWYLTPLGVLGILGVGFIGYKLLSMKKKEAA